MTTRKARERDNSLWLFTIATILCLLCWLLNPGPGFAAGDVDGDATISAFDASLVLQIVNGTFTPDATQETEADVDEDGEITTSDARVILYWASQEASPLSDEEIDFVEDIVATPISSATETVGTDGGTVAMATGERLTIPAAVLEEDVSMTLSKVDVGDLNPLGNQIWYSLYPDISEFSGVCMTIPNAQLPSPNSNGDRVEAVGLLRYDPLERATVIVNATIEQTDEGLLVCMPGNTQTTAQIQSADDTMLSASAALRRSTLYILVADAAGSMVNSQATLRLLDVPHYEQGLYNFCWATSSAMLTNFHLTPDDATHPWRKPQDFAEAMNIHWNTGGLSFGSLYVGSTFKNYLELITGIEPVISIWPISFASLRLYIKQQIMDHGRPVMLFLPQHSHYVVVTGYETRDGKPYVYINNPSIPRIGLVDWETLIDPDGVNIHSTFTCSVVFPTAGSGAVPVTVNVMGHKDIEPGGLIGLRFKHPETSIPAGASLRYSWFEQPPGEHCFLTSDGEDGGRPAPHIPDYYQMELYLRANSHDTTAANVKAEWRLSCSDPATPTYSGSRNNIALAGNSATNILFEQAMLDDLEGDCTLTVELSNIEAPYQMLDYMDIDMPFGEGIQVSAGSVEGQIQWTPYTGTFNNYKILRRESGGNWHAVAVTVAAAATSWTDSEWQNLDDGTYEYVVLAMHNVNAIALASDIYTATVDSSDGVVIFPDPNLETAVRHWLEAADAIPDGYTGDILRSHLTQLIIMDAGSSNIADLTGLEYCTNLGYLDLQVNNIVDISALATLTQLETLIICGNNIVDISPLTNLTALVQLNLYHNNISDISPLSGLTNLEQLDLNENSGITSLSALSGLTKLRTLATYSADIDSLAPISGLTALHSLILGDHPRLTSVAPVAALTNLEVFTIWSCPITSLAPLSGLTALDYVKANDTEITTISPLVDNSNITNGDTVYVEDNDGLFWAEDCDPANGDITFCTDVQTLENRGVTVHR